MKRVSLEPILALIMLSGFSTLAVAGTPGSVTREQVLLGMHFVHTRTAFNPAAGIPVEIASFWDYVEHMPEDLNHISYADFWHWWSEFERYKGDEKGFTEFDQIVEACLVRGIKVKVDVAWSTWWTLDKDWERDGSTVHGARTTWTTGPTFATRWVADIEGEWRSGCCKGKPTISRPTGRALRWSTCPTSTDLVCVP